MKKIVFAFACLLAGYALAHAVPTTSAQVVQLTSQTMRWEQFCEMKGGLGSGEARGRAVTSINNSLVERGREGWEIVATPIIVSGNNPGTIWSDVMVCYRRPAP